MKMSSAFKKACILIISLFCSQMVMSHPSEIDYQKALLRCAHANVYGEYAEGGGCNVYGCWPPGGSCTVFGCSALGECTVTHCPNQLDSFQCIKSDSYFSENQEVLERKSLEIIARAKYPCIHWNVFGDYAEGGGCNAFGCWPPGGSCNAFGCSAIGQCTAMNCPSEIPTYQCSK